MLDLGVPKRATPGITGQVGGNANSMALRLADVGIPFDPATYFGQQVFEIRVT